jgi:hypothetical protein
MLHIPDLEHKKVLLDSLMRSNEVDATWYDGNLRCEIDIIVMTW